MTVTTADVTRAYDAAKDAAVDATGNSASESRCVDALKLLAGMEVPLALFTDSVIGGVGKGETLNPCALNPCTRNPERLALHPKRRARHLILDLGHITLSPEP